jgi:chorismate mutase
MEINMIHIKRFIEKVSSVSSKNNKDIVLPIQEARGLRDEIAKLLAELYQLNQNKPEDVIKVELTAGTFK